MHIASGKMSATASLTALLLPADPLEPCRLVSIPNKSSAISDALGGGLIHDHSRAPMVRRGLTIVPILRIDE